MLYYNNTSLTLYFTDPPSLSFKLHISRKILYCPWYARVMHFLISASAWENVYAWVLCIHNICTFSPEYSHNTEKTHTQPHTPVFPTDCKAIGGGSAYFIGWGLGIRNFHELVTLTSKLHQISNFYVIVSTDDDVFMETHTVHTEGRGCVCEMCEWQRHREEQGKEMQQNGYAVFLKSAKTKPQKRNTTCGSRSWFCGTLPQMSQSVGNTQRYKPQLWSCCLRSRDVVGRQQHWTALMGTGAVTSGSPLAAPDLSTQTLCRDTDRKRHLDSCST